MDASDIKRRIKSGECSDDLICGDSVKWATNNLTTFKWYYSRMYRGTRAASWDYISNYAQKHNYVDVINFLKERGEYMPFKKTKISKQAGEGFGYNHCKFKGLAGLKEITQNPQNHFNAVEWFYLALQCGAHGSLYNLMYILNLFREKSIRISIVLNAVCGALVGNFPEILKWAETVCRLKIKDIIRKRAKIYRQYVDLSPDIELKEYLLDVYIEN